MLWILKIKPEESIHYAIYALLDRFLPNVGKFLYIAPSSHVNSFKWSHVVLMEEVEGVFGLISLLFYLG